jgi:hypothetical protein
MADIRLLSALSNFPLPEELVVEDVDDAESSAKSVLLDCKLEICMNQSFPMDCPMQPLPEGKFAPSYPEGLQFSAPLGQWTVQRKQSKPKMESADENRSGMGNRPACLIDASNL